MFCSPPRKSLVKGERFVRIEGKPELIWPELRTPLYQFILNYIHENLETQITRNLTATQNSYVNSTIKIPEDITFNSMKSTVQGPLLHYNYCFKLLMLALPSCGKILFPNIALAS